MKRLSVVFMTAILLSVIWFPKPANASQQETNITTETNIKATTEQIEKQTSKKKKNETVKVTISAAGDCTLGIDSRYNSSFNNYYARKGSAYFFKKVKRFLRKTTLRL